MTTLRQKIDEELNGLDDQAMALVYAQLRQINRSRTASFNTQHAVPSIEHVQQLTAESKSNWAEDVFSEREERL